jgi:DNA-binding response OmpR family regulator
MSDTPASILVVDDDVDTCHNLRDILTEMGYQVDVAHDGLQALEKVRQRAYDIALLDLKMPGMDGITLYREIRKVQASAVALVVTAFAGGSTTDQALAAGAWRVLSKPVDLTTLLGLVETAVGQPLIMVVDDDHDLCNTLWDLLREQGFRVGLAHDETEASRQLAGQPYRVVLIDMKLPKGDGKSVYRLVREANPKAKTIVITGHREEMDTLVQQVMAEGADAICYKPFDVPGLLGTLQHLAQSKKEEG